MKKKLSALLLALVLILSLLPTGAMAVDAPWNGSDKKEPTKAGEVYQIGTAAELAWFRDTVNSGSYSAKAELTADIDLNNKAWTPIGTESAKAFAGTFDGHKHTIQGLYINATTSYQGLLGYTNGATVKELTVYGSVTSANNYIGGIIGYQNLGKIENCAFFGAVESAKNTQNKSGYAGGIVGYAAGASAVNMAVISGCSASGTVKAEEASGVAGGIVGYAKFTELENCYNTGSITGASRAGGIAGQLQNNCTAQYCYSRGPAAGSATAADIVDFLYSSSSLSNCFYIGAKASGAGTGAVTDCANITTAQILLTALNAGSGNAWVADTGNINGGYPILSWQSTAPVEKVPVTGVSVTGSPRSGQTLSAVVSGAEGKTPTGLGYQWMLGNSADGAFAALPGETKKALTLSDAHIGKYLCLYVGGDEGSEARSDVLGPVLMSETAAVAADMAALGDFPAIIRAATTLHFPNLGAHGSAITWTSGDPGVIGIASGTVTLPDSSDATVTLTATIRCGSAEDTQMFSVTVLSQATVDQEASDAAVYLTNAVSSLQWYHLKPVYGTDTNVCDMLRVALANRGYDALDVSLKSADNPSDGSAAIAVNGDISYFYFDPSSTELRGAWFASIPVTFTLGKGPESREYTVNAVVYWDGAKAQARLSELVVPNITVPAEIDGSLSLPHYAYVGNAGTPNYGDYTQFYTWAEITWHSSSDAVTIGAAGVYPNTYAPYATTVKRTLTAQPVTLTATITLNKGADLTGLIAPVTLVREYQLTVAPMDQAEYEAAQQALLTKLNKGFASPGLTDYVTGAALNVSKVVNDIQFPTTRDYGVDGKYYPVLITSSNEEVIATSGINNAARVYVYRPLPGQNAETVILTVTITEKASGISAQKSFDVTVLPLTQGEIDAEIALMAQVKANYFNGIKNANSSADQITGDLHAFQEAYLKDGALTFVYDYKERVNHGIVPVAMDGWETLEQWRTFRSSNAAVITHENLLVTRQTESKAVTLTSYLSSETLGKYAEKYPQNADFQKLYYQPVTASLIVRGTNPTSDTPVVETLNASFTLQSADSTWISKNTISGLAEGSTVFDLFTKLLGDNGYTYKARGSYIYAITTPGGKTLSELNAGENSGWMYKVNGITPSAYMAAYPLRNGDNVVVFFTKDYTTEVVWGDPQKPESGVTLSPQVTARNGEAAVSVDAAAVRGALSSGGKVVIAPQVTGEARAVSVSLPVSSAVEIAGSAGGTLSVETAQGRVTLPSSALSSVAGQAAGEALEIRIAAKTAQELTLPEGVPENALIVEVTLTSGGRRITGFGGAALTLSLPAPAGYRTGERYQVLVISGDGTQELLTGTVITQDGQTLVQLSVSHLSTFVLTGLKFSAFSDVNGAAWYYKAVQYVTEKGLMDGVGGDRFAPENTMTRAMLATVLYRLAGSPAVDSDSTFTDVQAGQWYTDAVRWAEKNAIVSGYGDGRFGVGDSLTREQLARMLMNYARYKDIDVTKTVELTGFSDAARLSTWAMDAMRWALAEGLITGMTATTLSPAAPATRAQLATILMRFIEGMEAKSIA